MAKQSPLGEALASDDTLIARFVDIWRHPRNVGGEDPPFGENEGIARTPVTLNDIAWELGIGVGKAAITMKYAESAGWVRRTSPRTDQAAFEPTEKALTQYPDGAQVMPDPVQHQLRPGVTVRSETAEEARSWSGEEYIEITQPREPRKGLADGKKQFKGYLGPGEK